MKIRIKVYDEDERPAACRIVIGKRENPEEAGEIRYCRGECVFEADPGEYLVEAFKGKLYEPCRQTVDLEGGDADIAVRLKRLADPAKLGLYSFDAHSHVSRSRELGTGNLEWAATVMMAEDFNFFYAGSPYDRETHQEYIDNAYKSDAPYRDRFASVLMSINRAQANFRIDIGNELVKCRYGHLCMLNFVQKPPFSAYYDEAWDPWNDGGRQGEEPDYELAYPYEAVLAERGEHSFSFAAHPTSWWWGTNGIFITNIAATLGFDILAGTVDAMVVMGYGSDKVHYQQLWFDALRNGYFLPGVAETDVAFDGVPKQKFLAFKTFAFLEEFGMEELGRAMRDGRNIVSSGPLLVMTVNGQLPGAVLPFHEGETFDVDIEAYACCEAPLSAIQLIVNGEIAGESGISGQRFKLAERIRVEEDSFVIAKCYDAAGNVAMTSPVYIRNRPFVNRGYTANVRVRVTVSGKPAEGVYWLDDEPGRREFANGDIRLRMKPAAQLHVAVGGRVQTVKLFELDELQAIFKHLYLGEFNRDKRYEPGEVPADAFGLARIRGILDRAELDLAF